MPIRLRLALLVTAATLVLLTGAGFLFIRELQTGLQQNLDTTLHTRVEDLISQLGEQAANFQDAGPTPLVLGNDSYQQVLTDHGKVLDSSDGLTGTPLLTPAQATQAATNTLLADTTITPAGTQATQRVRLLATATNQPGVIVAVAVSRDVLDQAVSRATWQLLVLGIIVLLLAGPGAWLLAAAALRPVDRMRAQAAALQARDAAIGVAVPGTRDELARLAVTLNELLTRLHAAVEHERAFVADAGHELRTPLTVLKGELELAGRPGRSNQELMATVAVAAEETDRLIRLAEDLLTLGSDEAAAGHTRRFDLAQTVHAALTATLTTAAANGQTVGTHGPPALHVHGDPARIRQAIDNLLTNALRVAPPGPTITVTLSQDAEATSVRVRDCGPGFPVDFLPLAFERFTRADTARTRTAGQGQRHGTGLGLAIVKGVMSSHHGTATATNNTDGPGATVTLRWPTSPAALPPGETGSL
ncbi:MAG: HAMP domain-containing sensor histidine kinase [Nakamurella sp.]